MSVEYFLNKASEHDIYEHLSLCDSDFSPPLSHRVVIKDYARKLVSVATRFEAWHENILIGLVAAYCNHHERHISYITNVSVLKAWVENGIASRLLNECINHAKASRFQEITLEVTSDNVSVIKFYEKNGFVVCDASLALTTMNMYLKNL